MKTEKRWCYKSLEDLIEQGSVRMHQDPFGPNSKPCFACFDAEGQWFCTPAPVRHFGCEVWVTDWAEFGPTWTIAALRRKIPVTKWFFNRHPEFFEERDVIVSF